MENSFREGHSHRALPRRAAREALHQVAHQARPSGHRPSFRDGEHGHHVGLKAGDGACLLEWLGRAARVAATTARPWTCLLYTSDAADDM
eukprot:6462280-Alexandrium_andersonii.AAC.1